jgi:hypothetical protein
MSLKELGDLILGGGPLELRFRGLWLGELWGIDGERARQATILWPMEKRPRSSPGPEGSPI